jgi:conjugal transfer pilin signal peptidase TrbI
VNEPPRVLAVDCDARVCGPEDQQRRKVFWFAFAGVLLIALLFWCKPPVSLAFDPNDEKCLPDMHLSLMVHRHPARIADGDLVFWKPAGPLAYVKQAFVLKQVAGVTGDHLQIHEGHVLINGRQVVEGLALSHVYRTTPERLERDEVIPPGKLFVVGQHPHSDDSRYWGYLDAAHLEGYAIKLF